ncbi:hypothetical protein EMPS_08577 [Entomortierella parvispora]|uniref:Uncharacterized protein n=1 Tax=Entomortierella parvispora TaxID=205924 RepID=A0A9P3HGY6_9FUNG|nr:hypothetical protein EMPS_08577 [Entomortierella parvispora]
MQAFQATESYPAQRSGTAISASIQVLVHNVPATLPDNLACNCAQVRIQVSEGIYRACHQPTCCLTLYHLEERRNNKVESQCRDTASLSFGAAAITAHDADSRQVSVTAPVTSPCSSSDLRPVPRTLPQAIFPPPLFDCHHTSHLSVPVAAQASSPLYVYGDPLTFSRTPPPTLPEPMTAAYRDIADMASTPPQEPVHVQMQPLQQSHTPHYPLFHQRHGPPRAALSSHSSGPIPTHILSAYDQSIRSSTPQSNPDTPSYSGDSCWSSSQLMQQQKVAQDMKVGSGGLATTPASDPLFFSSVASPSPQPTTWLQQQQLQQQQQQQQQHQLPPYPSFFSCHSTGANHIHHATHSDTSFYRPNGQMCTDVSQAVAQSSSPQEVIDRHNSTQTQRLCYDPSIYHDTSPWPGGVETTLSVVDPHHRLKPTLSGNCNCSHHLHSQFNPSPQRPESGTVREGQEAMYHAVHAATAEGYPRDALSMAMEAAPATDAIKMEDEIDASRSSLLLFVAPLPADSNRYQSNGAGINVPQSNRGSQDSGIKHHRANTVAESAQNALLGQFPLSLDQYPHHSSQGDRPSPIEDNNARRAVRRKSSRMSVLENEAATDQRGYQTPVYSSTVSSTTPEPPLKKKSSTLTLKAKAPSSSSSSISSTRKYEPQPPEAYMTTFMAVPPEIMKSTTMLAQSSPNLILENFEPFSRRESSNPGHQ